MKILTTVTLLVAAFALPAMAQTPVPSSPSGATLSAPAGVGNNAASARDTVMTDNHAMRASDIIGSTVFNDQNQKIGLVDDLVIGSDHSIHAVLSVGGFLGVNAKLVEVPFDKLQVGSGKRMILPGTTKKQLTSMPDYHFANKS
jgi:sporulation protein YlmC with PRC-barrel domain